MKRFRLLAALLVAALLVFPLANILAAVDDAYTKALLHMEGTDASTTFTDESGKTWTPAGDAQIDTAFYKFGSASALFDGAGDYISTPNDADLNFGGGEFTIDFWIRSTANGQANGSEIIEKATSAASVAPFSVRINSGTNVVFLYMSTNGSGWDAVAGAVVGELVQNVWTHIAIVRSGSHVLAFMGGVKNSDSDIGSGVLWSDSSPVLVGGGNYADSYVTGNIDELRISKGIARWTANFTPPAAAYAETTPTPSPTETATGTSVPTFTPTTTATETLTPTITPYYTFTPNPAITWAPSLIPTSNALKNALAARLISDPPDGVTGTVYGIIGVDSDPYGGWYVSLAHVTGIETPYTGWNVEANSDWIGAMDCSGEEWSWSCVYYTPAFGGQEIQGLVFPFARGTWALYGSSGVHHDSGSMMPGDSAVDFVGDDSWSGSMPAEVYAAASGVVVAHCDGAHNGGIRVSGPSGDFMYFHLQPGQPKMEMGTSIAQGERIGILSYGTFNDSPCGYANQDASMYHLHFGFLPSGGYLQIGGCNLNLSTANWLCGSDTIGPLGHLVNSGGSAPAATVTPGGPTVTPNPGGLGPAEGGEHIWNGLISGFVSFIDSTVKRIFPTHTSLGLVSWTDKAYTTLTDFSWLVAASGLIWIVPSLICYGIILTLESMRIIYAIIRLIYGLVPMAA